MNVAVIDADLIGRKRHRFPNLCCMKISGQHKERGDRVVLKTNYENLETFDKVYVAKVFTDTPFDNKILEMPNVKCGGTGFYYDCAPPLPDEIEHHMPNYHLYDNWIEKQPASETKCYREYSIGYLTRGCFRHCSFCVNRNSFKVTAASSLSEFLDPERKKILLLDDNFFGYAGWRTLFKELQATKKPFCFKQGLDIRLLDDEKAEMLDESSYDGDLIFAFDNIDDAPLIEKKLAVLRRHTKKDCKLYCLAGLSRTGGGWRNVLETRCFGFAPPHRNSDEISVLALRHAV